MLRFQDHTVPTTQSQGELLPSQNLQTRVSSEDGAGNGRKWEAGPLFLPVSCSLSFLPQVQSSPTFDPTWS